MPPIATLKLDLRETLDDRAIHKARLCEIVGLDYGSFMRALKIEARYNSLYVGTVFWWFEVKLRSPFFYHPSPHHEKAYHLLMDHEWLDSRIRQAGGYARVAKAAGYPSRDAIRNLVRSCNPDLHKYRAFNMEVTGSLLAVLGVKPPYPFYLHLYQEHENHEYTQS